MPWVFTVNLYTNQQMIVFQRTFGYFVGQSKKFSAKLTSIVVYKDPLKAFLEKSQKRKKEMNNFHVTKCFQNLPP